MATEATALPPGNAQTAMDAAAAADGTHMQSNDDAGASFGASLPMEVGMTGLEVQFGHPGIGVSRGDERAAGGMTVMPSHPQQQQHHNQQQHPQQHVYQHQPQTPVQHHHIHQSHGGQFGILTPTALPHLPMQHTPHNLSFLDPAMTPSHQTPTSQTNITSRISHTGNSQSGPVLDPPDLEAWRERLFNVDEMIVLTNAQYETYWPHVDNVYSHRSTQRYKRKPFVSHYWDCRMKGRPSGTPKSSDPNKKKRKRVARERDLCDVKIKITEYFPGAQIQALDDSTIPAGLIGYQPSGGQEERFWTVQRVNGNGGNGKGDGVAGPHKHSLERSDEIKKSSVQRLVAKQTKEAKKTQKPINRKATGAALATIKKHSKDSEIKLYSASFCPFSHRVWIALEAKGLPYQYCEIDPYKKPPPPQLLEVNPNGTVPALKQGDWSLSESTVILEYLEDLNDDVALMPTDPKVRATGRLCIHQINTNVVPAFYDLLRQSGPSQSSATFTRLQAAITSLFSKADEDGPLFLGATISLVDIHLIPFAIRLRYLQPDSDVNIELSERWTRWLAAVEEYPSVARTLGNADMYEDIKAVLSEPRGLAVPA